MNGRDRRRIETRTRGQRDGPRDQLGVVYRTGADLFPIVIFRVDPEDGDSRDVVVARHLVGELQRRQRFEQREKGTAKESRLLAGDDGDRVAIGKAACRFTRLRRRLPPLLLSLDHTRDVGAPSLVLLGASDRVSPRRPIRRIAGKERSDGAKVVRIVRGEPANPRETPNVHRNAHGRALDRRRSRGSVGLHWKTYCLKPRADCQMTR